MSKERTSVIWTVILATCGIWIVVIGGWFVTTRYLSPERVSATGGESEAADTAAPAPRRRTPRVSRGAGSAASAPEHGASASTARSDAPPSAVDNDAPRSNEGSEPLGAAGRVTDASRAAEDEAARDRDDSVPATAAPPAAVARVADNSEDARTIVAEAQRRTDVKSHQYEGLLQMFDAKGKVTEKRWTFERLGSHGQSKVVVRFTAPPEVKGVALLVVNHPDRASDQWMWTPAIERDRRIALQDRSTRFFGTDFSFEDMEERDVDQYDYSMIGSETVDGASCWKIQWTPKQSRSSQYTRSIGWIRKDNYVLARIDNYIKNEVVRQVKYSTIENIQGIWTARELAMSDLRRGSITRLHLEQVSYGKPAKEENFTLQALRR
jgi:Outer membrane lipoprotein-sorting protein